MSSRSYEELVKYLEGMMIDGVGLVHGGHLISWEDTKIPDLVEAIRNDKKTANEYIFTPGESLVHTITGQQFSVVRDAGTVVHLISSENMTLLTKEEISTYFQKTKELSSVSK
jgi:hypothetical protein